VRAPAGNLLSWPTALAAHSGAVAQRNHSVINPLGSFRRKKSPVVDRTGYRGGGNAGHLGNPGKRQSTVGAFIGWNRCIGKRWRVHVEVRLQPFLA
jgi:hypothetical protein